MLEMWELEHWVLWDCDSYGVGSGLFIASCDMEVGCINPKLFCIITFFIDHMGTCNAISINLCFYEWDLGIRATMGPRGLGDSEGNSKEERGNYYEQGFNTVFVTHFYWQ